MFMAEEFTVYVSNIAFKAVPKDLAEALQQFGTIKKSIILTTRNYKRVVRSRGIGFVSFETKEQMDAAIAASKNVTLFERALRIFAAKPRRPQVTAFIAGIPAGTTKENVLEAFKAYNAVDARIIRQNVEGEKPRKGFGFVKFNTPEDKENCLKAVKTFPLNGGDTVVRNARRQFDAPPVKRHFKRNYKKAATE